MAFAREFWDRCPPRSFLAPQRNARCFRSLMAFFAAVIISQRTRRSTCRAPIALMIPATIPSMLASTDSRVSEARSSEGQTIGATQRWKVASTLGELLRKPLDHRSFRFPGARSVSRIHPVSRFPFGYGRIWNGTFHYFWDRKISGSTASYLLPTLDFPLFSGCT